MRGTIIGDVIGSRLEGMFPRHLKPEDMFAEGVGFTDDAVCTAAVADAIMQGTSFGESLRSWCGRFPDAGYGGMFAKWLADPSMEPYGSWGNGAPMRVSPCAWLAADDGHAEELAIASCQPTHGHKDAVAASLAVVRAIRAGRRGEGAEGVRYAVEETLKASLPGVKEVRSRRVFEVAAKPTVLYAAAAVIEASSFEEAVVDAVLIGGDTDTTAAIAGSIAESFMQVPDRLWTRAFSFLAPELKAVVARFDAARAAIA